MTRKAITPQDEYDFYAEPDRSVSSWIRRAVEHEIDQ